MAYTSKSIGIKLNSLKNFRDRDFAKEVLKVVNKYGTELLPSKFFEDSSKMMKYDRKDISNVVDLWMNEEKNAELKNYADGVIAISGKNVNYLINWVKGSRAAFNFLTLSVNMEYFKSKDEFTNFITLCKELIVLIEPVYGEIVNESFPESNMPINLRCRLPEIGWMLIFGKPYIRMFTKDKLLSTPCYKVESCGDSIMLQVTENVFDQIPLESRSLIKQHLGIDSFVESGKPVNAYKTGKVPDFDFSEVLFDKSKPPVEPKIHRRGE